MAKLVGAPFVKVEATKFTEVGYVGRDVESMVRDLVETSVRLVKEEKMASVKERAEENANRRLIELLVPSTKNRVISRILLKSFLEAITIKTNRTRKKIPEDLSLQEKEKSSLKSWLMHELESEMITVEVEEQAASMFDMLQGSGMEQMGMNMQDALGSLMPKKARSAN